MNFGKKSVTDKRDRLTSPSAKAKRSAGVYALRTGFFLLLFLAVTAVSLAFGVLRGLIASAPDISDVNIMPLGNASFIYDADGNELQKLTGAGGNRISISIDEIPLNMQHAIVAIEDERFYEHNGIDPSGILRAAVVGITNGFHFTEGASTITQQLLKNNVFTDWMEENTLERFRRKFQEQYLALELEKYLTEQGQDAKSVILENYLNTINLGSGCYGVQTAAQTYFGKDAKDLNLSECAVLAAIPQAPTRYNPRNHPENNQKRRDKVLKNMLDQGYITQAEYEEALNDNVYERIQTQSQYEEKETPYSYFNDEVISQVINDLIVQKGYTEIQAQNAVYSSGLRIYTTQDSWIQSVLDEEFQNPDNYPPYTQVGLDWALTVTHSDGTVQNYSKEMLQLFFRNDDPEFDLLFDSQEEAQSYIDAYKASIIVEGDTITAERTDFTMQPQACMTIIDQTTGYVKAIVGGLGEKTASLTLNRATDSYRQPGSAFKPLAAYGPALDTGAITLSTVIKDEPYTYSDGTPVRNSDGRYHGNVTVREAITNSYNIPAVKVLTEITPQTGYDYLTKFKFSKLLPSESSHQSIAIGGLTNGVSNLELAGAYAAIANGGKYNKPVLYTKVTDSDGNVLLDNTKQQSTQIFNESTAYLLTSAMEDVVKKGTATVCQLDDMAVAGKTGTTNDYKDLVFAGFTPYYTAAVWAGYDQMAEMPASDREFHKVLWQKVMQRIHEDLPEKEFEVPATVKEVSICSETGLLARSSCDAVTEYYAISDIPTKRCAGHYVAPPSPTPTPQADTPDSATATPTPAETGDSTQTTQEPADTPKTEQAKPEESTSTQAPADTQPSGDTGETASQ